MAPNFEQFGLWRKGGGGSGSRDVAVLEESFMLR